MSTPKTYTLKLRGQELLTSPRWNKGTAFTQAERKRFGLTGRLPHSINTLEDQCARAYEQLRALEGDLEKNAFLQSLKAQNWVLYYKLLEGKLREVMPIIYTPTEVSYTCIFTFRISWEEREEHWAFTRDNEVTLTTSSAFPRQMR